MARTRARRGGRASLGIPERLVDLGAAVAEQGGLKVPALVRAPAAVAGSGPCDPGRDRRVEVDRLEPELMGLTDRAHSLNLRRFGEHDVRADVVLRSISSLSTAIPHHTLTLRA